MIKLISWNVNGLRACLGRGDFGGAFKKLGADIFCVQETKMQRGQAEIDFPGYWQYWNSAKRKGYSGTLVLSNIEPENVSNGIGIEEHDQEGRVILLEYKRFNLVNVYTPNSQSELTRLTYRIRWEEDIRAWLKEVEASSGKPVVLCGDLNVAHNDIDLKNPKTNHLSAGFTDEERTKMTELLNSGFCDTFRYYNPDRRDIYTWWSYIGKAREKNIGWRIDYFIVSSSIIANVSNAEIYNEFPGSDHCPVGISLDIET